jgi:hypothetical protein
MRAQRSSNALVAGIEPARFIAILGLPFLVLSVQQAAANGSKRRHKAKAEGRSIFAASMPDPAASRTPPQRAE